MAAEESTPAEDLPATPVDASAAPTVASSPEVAARVPEFSHLKDTPSGDGTPMDRFYDVNVTVGAELGRVTMPLGELLKLGEGSVMKLERPVSAPVDLMAQGVRLARGEVVVVDDCFAIRVKEIESSRGTAE